MSKNNFFTKNLPTSLIFNGLNFLGEKLTEEILLGGGNVLLIDSITRKNIENIKKIKSIKDKNIKGEVKILDVLSNIDILDILKKLNSLNFSLFLGNFEYKEEINVQKNLELLDIFFKISKFYSANIGVVLNLSKEKSKYFLEYTESIEKKTLKEKEGSKVSLIKVGEVYGERLDNFIKTPINEIIESIKEKEKISINKENSFFHYIYLEDILFGIANILFSDKEGEFVLANKEDISNISLAFRISDITGFPITHKESREERLEDRIKNSINVYEEWTPKTSLEEGLKKTLDYKLIDVLKKPKVLIQTKNIINIPQNQDKDEKEIVKKESLSKLDISNFDNIKKNYLIDYDTKKKKLKKRKPLFSIIIIILLICIGFYTYTIYKDYKYIENNTVYEMSLIQNHNYNKAININSKISTKDSQILYLTSFLSPVLKNVYFYENKMVLFKYYQEENGYIKDTIQTAITYKSLIENIGKSKKIYINNFYYNKNINLLNKTKLIKTSLLKTFYNNLINIETENINIYQTFYNNESILKNIISGKKSYMIAYYNKKNKNNSLNIVSYDFISLDKGQIIKNIYTNNPGDLNLSTTKNSLSSQALVINSLTESAFHIKNNGVIYVNINIFNKLQKLVNTPNIINGFITSKNKLFLYNIIYNSNNTYTYFYN